MPKKKTHFNPSVKRPSEVTFTEKFLCDTDHTKFYISLSRGWCIAVKNTGKGVCLVLIVDPITLTLKTFHAQMNPSIT